MTASEASPSSARRGAFQPTKRHAGKHAHSRSKRGTLPQAGRRCHDRNRNDGAVALQPDPEVRVLQRLNARGGDSRPHP